MTQMPMLRVEVYARALCESQKRKENSVESAGSIIFPPLSKVETELPRGPETRHTNEHSVPPTCSEERRQLEPKLAFWSEFASAYAAQVYSLCASVTAVYLPFLLFGRVLTGLD